MKQTINVNICQSQFILDIGAFEMLRDYLDTLAKVFAHNPDRNELLSDIEYRIAELLMERVTPGAPVVTLETMETVIAQIGRPQDLSETEEIIEETPEGERVYRRQVNTELPPLPPPARINKRFYRSASDRMLGGVCGGIAAYFGVDSTWIRLATVALCFLSFSMVGLIYLILWIVVPEATTPLEQMQMKGEQPTLSNIADSISSNLRNGYSSVQSVSGTARNTAGSFARLLGGVAGVIAYIILGIVTLTMGAAAVLFFFLFVFGLVCSVQYWWFGTVLDFFVEGCDLGNLALVPYLTFAFFCLFLLLAIPTVVLTRLVLRKNTETSTTAKVAVLLIWIASFVASVFTFSYIDSESDIPVSDKISVTIETDTVTQTTDTLPTASDSIPTPP